MTEVAAAVQQAKAGQVEFRAQNQGVVMVGLGKVSFGADRLAENVPTAVAAAARP